MAIVRNSIKSSSGGNDITVVANYSALPDPTTVSGEFYWCSSSQGTSWLPGSLGGTYYNSGMYYSNGTTWEYINVPYQATQSEVNTGTNTDKFLTPKTFNDSTQLASKQAKTDWVDYSATSTINGWSVFTTKEIFIKEEDKGCFVKIKIEGTSSSGTTNCTLNFNADESKRTFTISRNAGTYGSGVVDTTSASNVLNFYNTVAGGAYTASGTKLVDVTLFIKKA